MTQFAVLTAVGPDKPGLVNAISMFILDHHCKIEDSRMGVLGGEFAMLILVSGAEPDIAKVVEGVEAVGDDIGLTIGARLTKAPEEIASESRVYRLTAFSMDHPGIVQQVARYLSERQVNVRSLETRKHNAPVSGQPLYALNAVIAVPTAVRIGELRRGLEEIGDREDIDIEFKLLT